MTMQSEGFEPGTSPDQKSTKQILAVSGMARQWMNFWFKGFILPPPSEA